MERVYRIGGQLRRLTWRSELAGAPELGPADDRTTAAAALRRMSSGETLLYEGDWHNARQLLAAVGRRLRPPRPRGAGLADLFRAERAARRQEHELLHRLAVPLGPGWRSPLRRAPDLAPALEAAFGAAPEAEAAMPLREVLGALGAWQWRVRGVPVPALGASVHPWYGVFAPIRGEYVDLVARAVDERARAGRGRGAPGSTGGLAGELAFDVGTGTGVLAVLLARAGARVVATDVDRRAVGCARETAERLGVGERVQVVEADLFPDGRAALVVANPPWVPADAHGALDRAVYDPGGALLERLVLGLREHLAPSGEAWLVLSDLAERLGLRPPDALPRLLAQGGLEIVATAEARPSHPRARDPGDPLAAARAAEVTRLYRLRSR